VSLLDISFPDSQDGQLMPRVYVEFMHPWYDSSGPDHRASYNIEVPVVPTSVPTGLGAEYLYYLLPRLMVVIALRYFLMKLYESARMSICMR